MSGIEVAGLVLGALPILFAAVDLPKSSIQRTLFAFRKRAYVGHLARALLLQKQTIAENVKSLATSSGCEETWILDDDPVGYLSDRHVQQQIHDYLGTENYAAFTGALEQSHDAVKKIARNLEGLIPGGKASSTEDLLEIITANRERQGKLDILPRVKLVFKVNELKEAVKELDDISDAIDRFVRVLLLNRQVARDAPSRKAGKVAKSLRLVRGFAEKLYLALLDGWRDGCHVQHEASLFLEDRLSTVTAIFERSWKHRSAQMLVFHLIFAAMGYQGKLLSYETAVQVSEEDDPDPEPPCPGLDRQGTSWTQVTFVEPLSPLPSSPSVTIVNNICNALESARELKQHVSLVLTKSQHMGVRPGDGKEVSSAGKYNRKISLKELLGLLAESRFNIPLKYRMLLALRVASNLLQLWHTKWLPEAWSKEAIYFLIQPSTAAGGSNMSELVDLDRPFVSVTIDDLDSTRQSVRAVEPKVALLELGILLLEIWHQQPFEMRFGPGRHEGYYDRLVLAIEWLDDMADPMPEQYDKAVSLCIRGVIGGDSHLANWEDTSFWNAICAEIIEPLFKNCKLWRGT